MRTSQKRALYLVFAVLLAAELVVRVFDVRLSGNLAAVAKIPEQISEAGRTQHHSLLLLGNSLVANGVDAAVLSAAQPQLAVAKVAPDGTGLWDWNCLLRHQVIDRSDVHFDTVVVGFAWHLLSDQTHSDPSRLGSLYCDLGDLGQPGAIGLGSIGDETEFVMARAMRVYAMREVLRNRVLSAVVPHYQRYTQSANAQKSQAGEAGSVSREYSYERLAALAARLRAKGANVVVVAMPVPRDYPLDEALIGLAQRGEIRLVDMRHLQGISPASYMDTMHLNKGGQQVLSKSLAGVLDSGLTQALTAAR